MPSATGALFGLGLEFCLNASVIWGTDDIYIGIITTAGNTALDKDAWNYWNDITAGDYRVSGTNWAADGVQADGEALSVVGASDRIEFDITDESTSTVTLSDGKTIVLYSRTNGSDATRELIGYGVMDTALAPAGGTLLLDFSANGFVYIGY